MYLKWELQLLPSEVEVVTSETRINELDLQVDTLEEKDTCVEREIKSLYL